MREINQKSNKLCYVLLYIAPIILSLFILSNNTSALDYQSNTNIQFTFNPTISVSISDNLAIDNLSPGTAKDSNIINVNVATNNVTGYTLSATVGNTNNPSNELRHSGYNDDNDNYKFTSTSTDITELTNLEPNTWGYNYSTETSNSNTIWHDYSTLPLYSTTGTTLSEKYVASNDNIKFKIGAKASSTQAAGTYTNTINFAATTFPSPLSLEESYAYFGKSKVTVDGNQYYTMQDMSTEICKVSNIPSELQVVDIRDNNIYWIAHLKDDNCWMTQNLDLDIGGVNTTALTSENTNLTDSGSGAYTTDYSVLNNIITWASPTTATTSSHIISGTTVEPAMGTGDAYYNIPQSAEGGDIYIYTSGSTSSDTVFASLSDCETNGNHSEAECKHYHVGNYYNWTAAIASSDSSALITQFANAKNDICPKNWRLPKGRASSDTNTTREFGQLFYTSGITDSLTDTNYATNGFINVRSNPLFFVRGGIVNNNSLSNMASTGGYWSSTINSNVGAINAYFYSSHIDSSDDPSRYYGRSIRCIAK